MTIFINGVEDIGTDATGEGHIDYTLSGTTLTLTVVGTLILAFPRQGTLGDKVSLDLTGMSWTFNPAAFPDSMTCGITDAVNWGNAMPWYDYLVNIDNTAGGVLYGTSRNPTLKAMPAHASINFSDQLSSGAQVQTSFVLGAVHNATHDGQAVHRIGSHTQTYSYGGVGAREWVIGALTVNDGYGKFQEGVTFTFPAGQCSAAAGKYCVGNGPTWATSSALYMLSPTGRMTAMYDFTGACTNGTDGNRFVVVLPYVPWDFSGTTKNTSWDCYHQASVQSGNPQSGIAIVDGDTPQGLEINYSLAVPDENGRLDNNDFTNAGDFLRDLFFDIQVFGS